MALEEIQTADPLRGAFGYFNIDKRREAQKSELRGLISDLLSKAGVKAFEVFDNTPEACDETEGGNIIMAVTANVSDDIKLSIVETVKAQDHPYPATVSFFQMDKKFN